MTGVQTCALPIFDFRKKKQWDDALDVWGVHGISWKHSYEFIIESRKIGRASCRERV